MDQKSILLSDINKDIPAGVDWHAGARRYVSAFFERFDRASVERYSLTKPFAVLRGENEAACADLIAYFNNFVNLVHRIKPAEGMRVLDVACGGGWLSHYMAHLGCETFGIDISAEFIDLARRRIREDRHLMIPADKVDGMFAVHDIEAHPLPDEHRGAFDIIVLESCLHHFVDPIAAMTHLAGALKDDGVVVVIEGENRKGPIKDEWMSVMREFDTLERPYPREHLESILDMAGLPEREFMGQLNGWFSLDDEVAKNAAWYIEQAAEAMNLCVCAKRPEPLARIFPTRSTASALRFGNGWFARDGGFRWCGPTGEIKALKALTDLRLTLHGHGKQQTVVVYGPGGERARAEFSGDIQSETVAVGDLAAGDILMLCSGEVFCPAWSGEGDPRRLSFSVTADE